MITQQFHMEEGNQQPSQASNAEQTIKRKQMDKQFMNTYFQKRLWKKLSHDYYNVFSIIEKQNEDRQKYEKLFGDMFEKEDYDVTKLQLDKRSLRAIGAVLGLGICDALGASTEFIHFDKQRNFIKDGFADIKKLIKQGELRPRSGKVGIWTDDCSMALCMADSLLINKGEFNPQHIRYMFTLWLQNGLNNGGRPYSIGLGGNISISMDQFSKKQTDYAEEGDRFNNGNGSLMRLAPVPIYYSKNEQKAMEYSGLSSRTTHNGDESKECSRLLALILVRLINSSQDSDWKQVLNKACQDFGTDVKSVKCLAMSQQEPHQLYQEQLAKLKRKFYMFNKKQTDRNWNWKDQNYTYSPTRNDSQPGYVGSYCMDALAMALHTVWFGKSFHEIAIKNANMGGDCDTVGAVAGQIAGAIYGIDQKMLKLYSQMEDVKEKRYQLFLKGYKLLHEKQLQSKE